MKMTKKDKRFIVKMRLEIFKTWMNTYEEDEKKFHEATKILKLTYSDMITLFKAKRWPR